MIGKWHLGDLWNKTNVKGYDGQYSDPIKLGFDDWILTEAEASNSMPNCGCKKEKCVCVCVLTCVVACVVAHESSTYTHT